MDERLFARLAEQMRAEPVVLASVLDTSGATPRKRDSRMLITAQGSEFSVGGGLAEARVVTAARELLATQRREASLHIDLSGRAGALGICGGRMRLGLRRWHGDADAERSAQIAALLRDGVPVMLSGDDLGESATTSLDESRSLARPDIRLLIVGAGHCGLALYELARHLSFDVWVHDSRPECFDCGHFARAQRLCGGAEVLSTALQTGRAAYAVLLNRDFQADVAALRVLCKEPPALLAMMGSLHRIEQVRRALPECELALRGLIAPVGLSIGAETPQEIAVSILAQLIERRSAAS